MVYTWFLLSDFITSLPLDHWSNIPGLLASNTRNILDSRHLYLYSLEWSCSRHLAHSLISFRYFPQISLSQWGHHWPPYFKFPSPHLLPIPGWSFFLLLTYFFCSIYHFLIYYLIYLWVYCLSPWLGCMFHEGQDVCRVYCILNV